MVDLEKRLRANTELFYSMVKLIPAKYYVMKDDDFIQSTKYFQNRKQKTSKEVHKEKIMNAKRKRLDPSTNNGSPSIDIKEDQPKESISEEADNDGVNCSQVVNIAAIKSLPLSVLRQKLRNKIEGMRAGRNADNQQKMKEKVKEQPKSKKRRIASEKPKESKSNQINKQDEDAESIMFNRFHINNTKKQDKVKKKHGKKELEYMLKKAKEHKKKVDDIASVDSKKAEEIMENEKWKTALSRASGIKKKDNPVLLQKTIKKIEKKKKHSSKEWKKRQDLQEQFKKKKQAKRERNIKERVEQKKMRKAGKKTNKKK